MHPAKPECPYVCGWAAAGFGTPVAVTAAILIGLVFSPLAASGLSLIANTAPVAYGALGTPIVAPVQITNWGGL